MTANAGIQSGPRARGRLRMGSLLCLGILFLAAGPRPRAVAVSASYSRYHGAIHIHTLYSDGSGTFPQVVEAAQSNGLDYLIFTDHNTLQPLEDRHERYWGRTLVLVGTEISTDSGHCLALDLPATFRWTTRDAQTLINQVNAVGGFTILAHPMSPRWLWRDWNVRGYTGIEIVNLSSVFDDDLLDATEGLRVQGRSLVRLANLAKRYLINADGVMEELTNNIVERERGQWDRLLRKGRQVVGIGSVDAHARIPVADRVFRVPTYEEAFESVRSTVLTLAPLNGDVAHDRKQIYSAFRNGRLYIVYPRVAPAPQFEFVAREGEREAIMGQPIRLEREVRFEVRAPGHARPLIRLLRDGREVAAAEGERLAWTATEPGAYRVEVYAAERDETLLDGARGLSRIGDLLRERRGAVRPWIFTNPIYVRR